MTVKSTKTQSTLVIKFKAGVNTNGEDVIKSQRFSKIKVTGTDEDVFALGTALGGLLENDIAGIVREDQNTIVNQ